MLTDRGKATDLAKLPTRGDFGLDIRLRERMLGRRNILAKYREQAMLDHDTVYEEGHHLLLRFYIIAATQLA